MDDDVAAVAGVVEEGLGGCAVEVGVGAVGADAQDDGVVFCKGGWVRSATVRRVEEGGVRLMEARASGTASPVPGR